MDYEIQIKPGGLHYVLTETGKELHFEPVVLDDTGAPYIPLKAMLMVQTLKEEGMELSEIIPGIPLNLS